MELPETMTFVGIDRLFVSSVDDKSSYSNPEGPYRIESAQSFELEIEVDNSELFGDEEKTDIYTKIIGMKASFGAGKVSIDPFALLLGANVEASGEAPNRELSLVIGSNRLPYVKLRMVSLYQGGADAGCDGYYEIELFKAKFMDPKFSLQSKTHGEISGSVSAIPPRNNPAGLSSRAIGRIRKLEAPFSE